MRFPIAAAAFGCLTVMSGAFLDAANNDAHAQIRQLKPTSPLAVAPGMQPADALARALQQHKQEKKLKALQAGKRARTKNMFQHRKSPFDRTYGNAKARNDIIRRMQK